MRQKVCKRHQRTMERARVISACVQVLLGICLQVDMSKTRSDIKKQIAYAKKLVFTLHLERIHVNCGPSACLHRTDLSEEVVRLVEEFVCTILVAVDIILHLSQKHAF
jgi:hypothetical protein